MPVEAGTTVPMAVWVPEEVPGGAAAGRRGRIRCVPEVGLDVVRGGGICVEVLGGFPGALVAGAVDGPDLILVIAGAGEVRAEIVVFIGGGDGGNLSAAAVEPEFILLGIRCTVPDGAAHALIPGRFGDVQLIIVVVIIVIIVVAVLQTVQG